MAATSPAPTLNTTITGQRPSSAQRILVIAENRTLQRTLQRLFSSEGYEVEIVEDLVDLEMIRKSPPSALILDLKYHASLGWELCREIAQSAPDVPLLILSANSDVVDKILLLEIGADDYIPLPFQPRELLVASPFSHKACGGEWWETDLCFQKRGCGFLENGNNTGRR